MAPCRIICNSGGTSTFSTKHRPARQQARLGALNSCAIFNALRDNRENKIASWDLSGEKLDLTAARALAEYAAGSKALKMIDLRSNPLGGEGMMVLGTALLDKSATSGLGFLTNDVFKLDKHTVSSISRRSTSALLSRRCWRACQPMLKNLNLLRADIGTECASALTQAFRERWQLESLCGIKPNEKEADSLKQHLGITDAALLATDLEFNTTLTKIDLRGNKFGSEVVAPSSTNCVSTRTARLRHGIF